MGLVVEHGGVTPPKAQTVVLNPESIVVIIRPACLDVDRCVTLFHVGCTVCWIIVVASLPSGVATLSRASCSS